MKLRFKIAILLTIVTCSFRASASDSIPVVKDARLDILSIKQAQANKRASMLNANGMLKGYRVQVISTGKRDEAFRIKSELLAKFPEYKSYALYQSPNFKVRIGNFLKKEDAEKLKAQLNKLYPQGVYIVEDGIEYTLSEEELQQQ